MSDERNDGQGPPREYTLTELALFRSQAALATSQADVELWKQARGVADEHRTRLVAELAESVRALAVSQGEVAAMKVEREGLYGEASYKMLREQHELACGQLAEARGDLERARAETRAAVVEEIIAAIQLGEMTAGDDAESYLRTVIATPTPTPEPDRASPEVTVKEPRP